MYYIMDSKIPSKKTTWALRGHIKAMENYNLIPPYDVIEEPIVKKPKEPVVKPRKQKINKSKKVMKIVVDYNNTTVEL